MADEESPLLDAIAAVVAAIGGDVKALYAALPGAPIVALTQAAYDALSPPAAGTLYIIVEGPVGGAGAAWLEITQADYDLLDPPDDETLYIVTD